ncbi:MAG: helix-turn-helix domain-containing protein [Patescibacteria group bacterium]
MKYIEALQTFNLTEKQATIYVTCLKVGSASVYELALKSGLKRPTTYIVVDELLKSGFLQLIRRNNKNYYQAISPKKLLKAWKNNLEMLENITPELEKMVRESKSKPKVEFYEGIQGIKKIYTELDPDIYHNEELCWWGSCGEGFEKNFPERITHWQKVAKDKRHYGREILDRTPENIKFFHNMQKYDLPHYNIRYTKKGQNFGPVDIALFKDSVYIISLMRDLFAIKITSQQIKDAFQIFYELAWKQAEKL